MPNAYQKASSDTKKYEKSEYNQSPNAESSLLQINCWSWSRSNTLISLLNLTHLKDEDICTKRKNK